MSDFTHIAVVRPEAARGADPIVAAPSKSDLVGWGPDRLAEILIEAAGRDARLRAELSRAARARIGPALPVQGGREGEPHMVGDSPAMRAVFDAIRRFAPTDLPVLITGESGTGKELAALAIHERSPFSGGPFVAVNAGGLPPSLIASELFGHEKGAFTGAVERRIGRIEQARGGTLFLDEIGDLPLELQAHLLRFLQERTIQRVGGQGTVTVRTRIVAATNVDLAAAVAAGRFRQDLFFRLDVLRIHLPPLRARAGDIGLLARYVVDRVACELGRSAPAIEPEAMAALERYAWPGNIRELISKVRRAVLSGDGAVLRAGDFDLDGPAGAPPAAVIPAARELGLDDARSAAEAAALRAALASSGCNITRAARELGVSRVTIYKLMRKHGLTRGDAR